MKRGVSGRLSRDIFQRYLKLRSVRLLKEDLIGDGIDPSLLKAVARGYRWFSELASGRAASIREIAERERVYDSYVKRLIPLALLAPEIVQRICDGSQPATLTAEALKHTAPLPLEWTKQRQILRCG